MAHPSVQGEELLVRYAELTARILLGLVFAAAAVKLRSAPERAGFRSMVAAVRLLPAGLVGPLAVVVAAGEVLVVLLLIFPGTSTAGFALAAVLLTGFLVVTGLTLRRGIRVACHCFGASRRPLSPVHLGRDALLLAVAVTGLAAPPFGAPSSAEVATSVIAAVAGALLVVFFVDFVAVFADPMPGRAVPQRRKRT